MKFEIAKITQAVRLSGYAAEYGELEIRVWVNPPQRLLQEHDRIVNAIAEAVRSGGEFEAIKTAIDETAEGLVKVFAELWSQGPEGTRWSEEEIRQLVEETMDTDPQLWPWLRNQTIEAIRTHRSRIKKD